MVRDFLTTSAGLNSVFSISAMADDWANVPPEPIRADARFGFEQHRRCQ